MGSLNTATILRIALQATSEDDFRSRLPEDLNTKQIKRAVNAYLAANEDKIPSKELPSIGAYLPKPGEQQIELWILDAGNPAPIFRASTDPGAVGQQDGTAVYKLRHWLDKNKDALARIKDGSAQIVKVASREPTEAKPAKSKRSK